MVLEEDAHKYFEMGNLKSNKFMTVSFPANQYAINNIYGVLHVDNTCRIQTISEEDGVIFELLNEFKKITGHGVLLNTSFNIAGEPLVETPEDAINTLRNSPLDYVWFPEKNCVVN
jgi:carbamoyltransferase